MRPSPRPVEESDLAKMLLDNLLDDREAESGPPHPRRHIRFGEPLPIFRKADTGIEHVDDEALLLLVQLQLDTISGNAMLTTIPPTLNGFNAILDNIRESLRKLATVAHHAEIALRGLEDKGDRRVRDLVKEQRLTSDLVDI